MKRISVLLLALVLSGCATVPNTSIEATGGEIPAGNGLVIAETITNGERITGQVRYWTDIILWRQDYEGEDKTFSVDSLSYSLSTQAYMGSVPAGKYRVGMLYAFLSLGDISYTARAFAPPALGTFEVKAGQVTNLGTILYQPFQDMNRIEQTYPDYAMTRIANDALWSSAARAFPDVAAQIDGALPVLGWNEDSFGPFREETARLIKEAGLPTSMHAQASGRATASGLLGGIFILDDGEWSSIHSGNHYKVTDVVELPSGQILTGHELGRLGLRSGPDAEPRYIEIGNGLEHVLDIDLSAGGQPIVITFTREGYNIYRFDLDTESATRIKDLPKKKVGFFEAPYQTYVDDLRHPNLVTTESGVAIYFEKAVHRYDEATNQWTEGDSPEFGTLYQQRDKLVSGTPWSSWTGVLPMRYTADDGASWTQTAEKAGFFGASREPTYRFADGELLRPGDDVDFNFWTASEALDEVPMLSSSDNGLNWEAVSTVRRGCITLAVEASSDESLHILCNNGGILTSTDRGRTWSQALDARMPGFDEIPGLLKVKYERE